MPAYLSSNTLTAKSFIQRIAGNSEPLKAFAVSVFMVVRRLSLNGGVGVRRGVRRLPAATAGALARMRLAQVTDENL
jgi:hypothetical protein